MPPIEYEPEFSGDDDDDDQDECGACSTTVELEVEDQRKNIF